MNSALPISRLDRPRATSSTISSSRAVSSGCSDRIRVSSPLATYGASTVSPRAAARTERDVATVLVTHDLDLVSYADRHATMLDGALQEPAVAAA